MKIRRGTSIEWVATARRVHDTGRGQEPEHETEAGRAATRSQPGQGPAQGHQRGLDPSGQSEGGPRQIQDSQADSTGQHQEAHRRVRVHVRDRERSHTHTWGENGDLFFLFYF